MTREDSTTLWAKPELTVLVRGAPQESVLTACKTLDSAGPVSVGAQGCHTYQSPDTMFCSLPEAS